MVARVAGLVLVLALVPLRAAQPAQGSAADLLDAYSNRRFDIVDATLSRVDRAGSLASELQQTAAQWVSADRAAAPARRFASAAVALELAGRSLEARDAQRILIPWAAELLAKQAPDERERAWLLAANALVQRTYDPFFLPRYGGGERGLDFPGHAIKRFPDEDRFHLARAIELELASWRTVQMQRHMATLRPTRNSATAGNATLLQLAAAFMKLLPRQSIAADVRLRLGQTFLRLERFDDALKQLDQVEARTKDPFLIYLSRYFTGVARRGSGDPTGAARAFRSALEVVPHAQSAALALASLAFGGENPADAYALVRTSVARAADVDDPWRQYQEAEYRLWHSYVTAMRKEVR